MKLLTLVAISTCMAAGTPLTLAQKKTIAAAVGDKLKDAETAKYKWPNRLEGASYCGWVNAKNEYGAYVGYRLFYVMGLPRKDGSFYVGNVILSTDDPSSYDKGVAEEMCAKGGYDISAPPPTMG